MVVLATQDYDPADVALVDHWGVSGGLGFAGRLIAFGLLAAGMLARMSFRWQRWQNDSKVGGQLFNRRDDRLRILRLDRCDQCANVHHKRQPVRRFLPGQLEKCRFPSMARNGFE